MIEFFKNLWRLFWPEWCDCAYCNKERSMRDRFSMRSLLQSMLMQDPSGALAVNQYWLKRIEEVLST